jgi:hypothetical protein
MPHHSSRSGTPQTAAFRPHMDFRPQAAASMFTSAWMPTADPQGGPPVHRVPMGPMSDYSPVHQSPQRVASATSFDSPHEAAASVLLLAASCPPKKVDHEDDEGVPLKKRKKMTDILRGSPPCHVSPMSHASKTDVSSPHSQASQDKPGWQAHIPAFVSVLHTVLTESDFAGKVVQWLPHGKAWKIVLWDALRRQVLPMYFPQLQDTPSSGSIDAFLWHLQAWGFAEINEGPDAGAYTHVVSRYRLVWVIDALITCCDVMVMLFAVICCTLDHTCASLAHFFARLLTYLLSSLSSLILSQKLTTSSNHSCFVEASLN